MKKIVMLFFSALMFLITTAATSNNSLLSNKANKDAFLLAKLSTRYPLNYPGYKGPKLYTTFKKNTFSAHYAVAYTFTPHPTDVGEYEGNIYFVYGVDETDFVLINAPSGGINLSGTIQFSGLSGNYPFSVTIPQGSSSKEHEPLPFIGWPTLSSLSVSPSTYSGNTIYTFNGN